MTDKEATRYFNRYARYYDGASRPFYAIQVPGGASLTADDVFDLAEMFRAQVLTEKKEA